MQPELARLLRISWLTAACFSVATADEPPAGPATSPAPPTTGLSDLSIANFFSDGWTEAWSKRPHPDGAPDLTLLRVQSNLLLQSSRTDYYYQVPTSASADRRTQYLSELIEYALNRRLMLAVFGNYQWVDRRETEGIGGGTYGALTRLQLVDLPHASYAFNWRIAAPNDGLGEKQTPTSFAVAGWHDLTPVGLDRVGLYWHLQEETLLGPRKPEARQNDLTYDLTLARTWSTPDQLLGIFSTFVEAYSKTDLDGRNRGHSVVTLTPGLRFNLHHHHVVMMGVDLPLNSPRPFDQLFRLTYIYSF